MLERDVIRRTLQNTKKMGIRHIRMTFRPGVGVGVPDFLFLIPGGRPLFIEFKAPRKKPTERQKHVIKILRELGYHVEVCDCPNAALEAISSRVEASGPERAASGSLYEFFLKALIHEEKDSCLVWPFHTDETGRGKFRYPGTTKQLIVSREVCKRVWGSPKEGQYALHSCDNPSCVNPHHIRWGSAAENSSDMVKRSRSLVGEKHPQVKITAKEALSIFKDERPPSEIAKTYRISRGQVYNIKNGISWSSATGVKNEGS